jgi:hypothetical protein
MKHITPVSFNKNSLELFLISFISLFLELAIIRWLSSEVRIFAYFKNLPLMAAFLGFGIGFFLYKKSPLIFSWFPRLICILIIIIAGAPDLGITHVIFVDPRQYFLLGTEFGDHAVQSIPSVLSTLKAVTVIVFLFFLTMATFAALSSKIGELINQEKPLTGYSINVAGSLFGIIGFSLVSFLEWAPVFWLIIVFMLLLHFYKNQLKIALPYFLAAVTVTFIANFFYPAAWSPYYRISVHNAAEPHDPDCRGITVNYDGFQSINNLSPDSLSLFSEQVQRAYNRHYNIPYSLSSRKIDSVLILGGGAGNDAAAAIRNGARHIDVVEIDPVIARIGRNFHPENPYSSEKVYLHIDDARSFLQKTREKYDLVVFATLDSHTVFSSLSSLRLDNFVFTRESVVSARDKLQPGGGIAINFFVTKPWLLMRHLQTFNEVMGNDTLLFAGPEQEVIILTGTLFEKSRSPGITNYIPAEVPSYPSAVESTTDDWPFLFLEKRGLPFHYILPLLIIFALSLIPLRISQIKVADINWHLFFMGAAFLLIETKAVTTLALIFGSTWMVNSIVFSAVLVMILLANLIAERLSFLTFESLYIGLFAALFVNYFFNFHVLNQFDFNIRVLLSSIFIGLPLFFAALIFARAFSVTTSPSIALASNLFGALIGGLLEYLDMWTGLRFLNIVALILYVLSFIFLYGSMRSKSSQNGI